MSRFLDQIRKAKEARERALRQNSADKAKGQHDDALVPDGKARQNSGGAQPPPDEGGEDLFPDDLQKRKAAASKPEPEQHPSAPQDEDTGPLYPGGLEKAGQKAEKREPAQEPDVTSALEGLDSDEVQQKARASRPAKKEAKPEVKPDAMDAFPEDLMDTPDDVDEAGEGGEKNADVGSAEEDLGFPQFDQGELLPTELSDLSRPPRGSEPSPSQDEAPAPSPPPPPGPEADMSRETKHSETQEASGSVRRVRNGSSEENLFPEQLSDKDEDEAEDAAEDRQIPVFPDPDQRRQHKARPRRSPAGKSRSEIVIPGPEPDPEYIDRLAKVMPQPHKHVISFYDPQDHVCEEYRLLGKNILHTFAASPGGVGMNSGKVVTLSSSARGEGKTLTSLNLAMTLAQDLRNRVLLIDADLRHPKTHKYLGLDGGSNFNDLLKSKNPERIMEDCILRTDMGLHLLTSAPMGENPAPLLDSPNTSRIFDLLRRHYSLVIVDTPPVLLATDALTCGVRSDGMLFLLRARHTRRESIQEARQRIARLEIRMLGYVINNVKSFLPKIWSKYYYGYYNRY